MGQTIEKGSRGYHCADRFCVLGERRSSQRKDVGRMSHGRGAGRLTAALLVLAVASACSGTPDDSPTSPVPTVPAEAPASTFPSPSPSPSPASEADLAAANAEAVLRDFYRVTDDLSSDPSRPLTDLDAVATSIALDSWTRDFQRSRQDELRQSGATRLVEVNLVDVSLDNSDPEHGKVPSVRFEVCWDISDVVITKHDGTPADLPAERPKRGWERLIVSNYSWDSDPAGGWRVASGETLEREPCEAG